MFWKGSSAPATRFSTVGCLCVALVPRDQMDLPVLRYDFVNHAQDFSATPDACAGRRLCAASSDGRFRDLLLVAVACAD
jgi:hypothetical protein